MRRKRQLSSREEAIEMLVKGTAGVLSVAGDGDYPYGVPISYTYEAERLFFHSAREGHKIDAIKRNDKVSFCVIAQNDVQPETFTTHYRSVIVFGRARILTEDNEKRHAIESLLEKYSPGFIEQGKKEIERDWNKMMLVEIRIEHVTGKAAKELILK